MAPLDFRRDKLATWMLNRGDRNVEETKVISPLPATSVRKEREGFNHPSNLIYIDFTTYMFDFYYCNNWRKQVHNIAFPLDNLYRELPDTDPPPFSLLSSFCIRSIVVHEFFIKSCEVVCKVQLLN